MTEEREPRQAGAQLPTIRPPGEDPVEWDSEESFPASDPPGWSGSASVSREAALRREEPPAGPQADWTVETEVKTGEPRATPTRGDGGTE